MILLTSFFKKTALKEFNFGETFTKWIQILLRNQESCITNSGNTTKYFKLEKSAKQGGPISAYLFILVLEIASLYIKKIKMWRVLIFLTSEEYSVIECNECF